MGVQIPPAPNNLQKGLLKMICELCGKNFKTGVRLKVEGSVVSACESCASHGEVVSRIMPAGKKPEVLEVKKPVYDMQDLEDDEELVDDFGRRVKKAREKRGLKQGELARMVNESESVIHRIELGKFEPHENLVRRLEHKLNINLTSSSDEEIRVTEKRASGKEVTLGDVVVVRKNEGDK